MGLLNKKYLNHSELFYSQYFWKVQASALKWRLAQQGMHDNDKNIVDNDIGNDYNDIKIFHLYDIDIDNENSDIFFSIIDNNQNYVQILKKLKIFHNDWKKAQKINISWYVILQSCIYP